MEECEFCGRKESMPYTCSYCNNKYCGKHRLPEKHACTQKDLAQAPNTNVEGGSNSSLSLPRMKNIMQYTNQNMTFIFLAIIVVVYLIEIAVITIFGTELFYSIFTASTENPEFVWTWVISVFSHDPVAIFHIVGNSIVLFFFGPLVEKYMGTKKYTLFFVITGVIAGISQVAVGLLTNEVVYVLGASGAIMGIMAILTVLRPRLTVYLYFILPVPLWIITIGYAGFSIFASFLGQAGGVAHMAHLTGLLIGVVVGIWLKKNSNKGVQAQELKLGGR